MNVVERAKNLIVQPRTEWPVIAAESHTVQGLYTHYVLILAAIPAVASFIGGSLVGFPAYRIGIGAGIAHTVLQYLLSLAMVYVLALVIDALAPHFGAQKNFSQAFKVAAFAPTASWLAGAFFILPALGILALLGLYSLYLLYTGLPPVMKPAEDKAIVYTAVVVIAAIVLNVVIAAVAGLAIPSLVRGF